MASRSYQSAEDKANRLFQQKTVAEIKSIEKQTRNDIERKKEELRQMVGERYRELIDAADTIVDMKKSANKVLTDINHMQRQCSTLHKLHQQHSVAAVATEQDKSMMAGRLSFFSLVSQIKLLVTMPEKLWTVLESHDGLCAARLCLMAHHIMDSVNQLTASGDLRNAVKSFPILPRQWAAISHFPALVLQASRVALQDPHVPLKRVEESLAAVLLLEKSSLSQVFQELLSARKAAVKSLFSAEKQGQSVKELSCRLVWLIRTTLQQVYAIFLSTSSSSTRRVVQLACESVSLRDLQLGYWSRFLPASLQEFEPTSLDSLRVALSENDIHTQCNVFLSECAGLVPSSLSSALTFVTSLESLVSVRDAVYTLLAKDDSLVEGCHGGGVAASSSLWPTNFAPWDVVCRAVTGHQLLLYDVFLRDSLEKRMQGIICSELSQACTTVHDSILSLLVAMPATSNPDARLSPATPSPPATTASSSSLPGDMSSTTTTTWLDRNIGAYIWQENADTMLPCQPASLRTSNRDLAQKADSIFSSLSIKSRGITPAAARACSTFNSSLTSLLSGVRLAVGVAEKPSTPVRRKPLFSESIVEAVPFEKFSSASKLRLYLRMTCFETTSDLVNKLETELERLQAAAEDERCSSSERARSVDCCLLLARLASSLSNCCPSLEACLLGLETATATPTPGRTLSRRSMSSRSSLAVKTDAPAADLAQLNDVKENIGKLVFSAYSVWISSTVNTMMAALRHCILSDNPRTLLAYAMAWEEIKIEEEGEEGRKVESTIRLPMQISSSVSSALFLLCEEISRVGGHTVLPAVQQTLIRRFGDRLLDVFEDLLGGVSGDKSGDVFSRRLPQPRALQSLFDIKCSATLLAGRGGKAAESSAYNSRVRALISWLESCVDPFDLDVFEPYLASNLSRCVQRCSSLYGALYSHAKGTSSNFVGGASALAAAASSGLATGKSASQEQHNVVPMASSINRLPLLPVGTGMASTHAIDKLNTARQQQHTAPPKLGAFVHLPELDKRMDFFSLSTAARHS